MAFLVISDIWFCLSIIGLLYYSWDITSQYITYETKTNFKFIDKGIDLPLISVCYSLLKFYKYSNLIKRCKSKSAFNCLLSQPNISSILNAYPGFEAMASMDERVKSYN